MKSILILALVLFTSFTVRAEDAPKLPENVIAEITTHVGFAPPEMVGTYRFQVLSTGVMQKVNNKDVVKVVGTLSLLDVIELTSMINAIKSDKLKEPKKGPICMDVPSQQMTIKKDYDTYMVIWTQSGCKEHIARDPSAKRLAEIVNQLESLTERY